ncbi:cysteine hydrolase family protein [Nocardia sp. alder85J]|uniref:cysteine hydrolase family protein n=1 Tax=Nocardia sp. alder85J TaxID=2862949 RepID=UPI001CD31BF7|nr:cysteine hydrolase [Nocardia sp. alder85J]MCX4099181.1 cysteine hydrolase [Nocardia sp. alder85J]
MAGKRTPWRILLVALASALLLPACGHPAEAAVPNPGSTAVPVDAPGGQALRIDPAHTALLVMDMQQGIVSQLGGDDHVVTAVADAERASRTAGVAVDFETTAFAPGYPEVSPDNKAFGPILGSGTMIQGSPETRIDPRVAPAGDEPVIVKHRVGAFGDTSLDQILRAKHIDTLVLTGLATSGVVLSTLRAAADLDYRVIVLSDGVADTDPQVGIMLLDKVFPAQADVVDVAGYRSALAG